MASGKPGAVQFTRSTEKNWMKSGSPGVHTMICGNRSRQNKSSRAICDELEVG